MTGLSAGECAAEDLESGDLEALKEEGDRAAQGDLDVAADTLRGAAGDAVGVGLETAGDEDLGSSDLGEDDAVVVVAGGGVVVVALYLPPPPTASFPSPSRNPGPETSGSNLTKFDTDLVIPPRSATAPERSAFVPEVAPAASSEFSRARVGGVT